MYDFLNMKNKFLSGQNCSWCYEQEPSRQGKSASAQSPSQGFSYAHNVAGEMKRLVAMFIKTFSPRIIKVFTWLKGNAFISSYQKYLILCF